MMAKAGKRLTMTTVPNVWSISDWCQIHCQVQLAEPRTRDYTASLHAGTSENRSEKNEICSSKVRIQATIKKRACLPPKQAVQVNFNVKRMSICWIEVHSVTRIFEPNLTSHKAVIFKSTTVSRTKLKTWVLYHSSTGTFQASPQNVPFSAAQCNEPKSLGCPCETY